MRWWWIVKLFKFLHNSLSRDRVIKTFAMLFLSLFSATKSIKDFFRIYTSYEILVDKKNDKSHFIFFSLEVFFPATLFSRHISSFMIWCKCNKSHLSRSPSHIINDIICILEDKVRCGLWIRLVRYKNKKNCDGEIKTYKCAQKRIFVHQNKNNNLNIKISNGFHRFKSKVKCASSLIRS